MGADTEEDRKILEHVEVSPEEERRLGQAVLDGFLSELKRQKIAAVSRGKDAQYLRDLIATVRPKMTHADRYRAIDVYVVQSPLAEARSVPGGTLVFFRGLLESAGSEAAVVSVVGHELAHLDRGHQLYRVKGMKLAQQSFRQGAGPSPAQFMGLATQMVRLWARPFRPEDETAADRDAVRWTFEAGYDPRAVLAVFDAIRRQKKGPPIPMPAFLQSHPPPESRRNDVMALYDELTRGNDGVKLYVGRENLRRRTARARQEFPE
jgi:predicted Zn-dependent protease